MSALFSLSASLSLSVCAFSCSRKSLVRTADKRIKLSFCAPSDLTGSVPQPVDASLAGTTHDLDLNTAYYTATVPLWLDLISDPADWALSFLSDEAKEVLQVLGGLLVVFALPKDASSTAAARDGAESTRTLITEVGKVVKEGLGGWEWDGVTLAVGVGQVDHLDDLDVWDEVCGDAGLEFVHVASSDKSPDERNEYGGKSFFFLFLSMFSSLQNSSTRKTTMTDSPFLCRKDWHSSCLGGSTVQ